MSTTVSPEDVLTRIKPYFRDRDFTSVEVELLDAAAGRFGSFAPWKWLTANFTAVPAADSTQDYSLGATPTRFARLLRVLVISGTEITSELQVVPFLPVSTVEGPPGQVSTLVNGANTDLRLFPVPPAGIDMSLLPIYKISYTPVTSANKNTGATFDFSDEYLHVYELFLMHYAAKASGLSSGSAVIAEGPQGRSITYSGLLAEAMAAAREIAVQESLHFSTYGQALIPE